MKNLLASLLLFLTFAIQLPAQTKRVLTPPPPAPAEEKPKDAATQDKSAKPSTEKVAVKTQKLEDMVDSFQIMEKGFWKAWQDRDSKVFEQHMAANAVMIDNTGVADRAAAIKGLAACDVRGYTLSDFKLTKLNNDAALLTYKADNVQAVCDGQKAPASLYASTVFTKSGGKWWMSFHQESTIIPNERAK